MTEDYAHLESIERQIRDLEAVRESLLRSTMIRPDSANSQDCKFWHPKETRSPGCYSDGHYMCRACASYVPEEDRHEGASPPSDDAGDGGGRGGK